MRVMKDSGIEWVGQVPNAWMVRPIRADFFEVTEKNKFGKIKKALKFTYGRIIPKENFDSDDDTYVADTILNYTIVRPNTIMLNCLNLNFDFVSQRIGMVTETGVITSAYIAFKASNSAVFSPYATYLFKSYDNCKAFHNMGGGVRKILNFEEFKKKYYLLPSLSEQKAISVFLDTKCSEIDALVADIQKQIDTLEEYKRSVITEAVTKGIRKSNESTDTAIPWIKQMPTRWRLSRIKYEIIPLSRSVKGTDEVITCFRDGQVTLRKYRREEGFTISFTENGYQGVEEGDLVIHGMDTFAGAIGCSECRGKCTPVVHVCKTTGNNRYFMYYLRSLASNEVLWFYANGVRVRSSDFRNFSNLGKFTISVPPISEQNEIVEYLDSKCAEIDSIIAEKKQQIDTIEEYKKSLIFEYVTGKKEVQ